MSSKSSMILWLRREEIGCRSAAASEAGRRIDELFQLRKVTVTWDMHHMGLPSCPFWAGGHLVHATSNKHLHTHTKRQSGEKVLGGLIPSLVSSLHSCQCSTHHFGLLQKSSLGNRISRRQPAFGCSLRQAMVLVLIAKKIKANPWCISKSVSSFDAFLSFFTRLAVKSNMGWDEPFKHCTSNLAAKQSACRMRGRAARPGTGRSVANTSETTSLVCAEIWDMTDGFLFLTAVNFPIH